MLCVIVRGNLYHYFYGINADIASEGILAKLIWDTKEWIPSTWYVATETRIFNVANIAAVVYGIVKDMDVAVGISCCIVTAGILGSEVFFAKAMEFDKIQTGIFILLSLILPNNFMIAELLYLHASYYAPHVIVLFFTVAVYVLAIKNDINSILAAVAVIL